MKGFNDFINANSIEEKVKSHFDGWYDNNIGREGKVAMHPMGNGKEMRGYTVVTADKDLFIYFQKESRKTTVYVIKPPNNIQHFTIPDLSTKAIKDLLKTLTK